MTKLILTSGSGMSLMSADVADLLSSDLSALLVLRPCLLDLLDELPSATSGLGTTEMRLLELLASGYASTSALFHRRQLHRRRVFGEWEMGALAVTRSICEPAVAYRIQPGSCRAQGRFQPRQPDPSPVVPNSPTSGYGATRRP